MNLEIATHQAQLNEPVESLIRDQAAKLERFYQRITRCRVMVDGQNGKVRQGEAPFAVRIDLSVPRGMLNVRQHKGSDLPTVVRDAFRAARRQLEVHVEKLRGDVKGRESPPLAEPD